jgi:hypothetical protein
MGSCFSEYAWNLWGVAFNSSLLNKLVLKLKKEGFQVEEPHWHISFYEATKDAATAAFENKFKNMHWKLFLVQKPDKNCQTTGTGCRPEEWEPIW